MLLEAIREKDLYSIERVANKWKSIIYDLKRANN